MIILLFILGFSFSVQAQMTDLMGTLAIDRMMNAQAAKGFSAANLQMKKNNLANGLQIKNIEIQTLMNSNLKNVSRETFSVAGYQASIKKEGSSQFSILVKGIEKQLCLGMDNHFAGAQKIKINNKNSDKNNCLDKNNIQFYY